MTLNKLLQRRLTVYGRRTRQEIFGLVGGFVAVSFAPTALAFAILGLTSTEIKAQPAPKSATTQVNPPNLNLGMRGAAVRNLQTILKQRGFYRSNITDKFDARTQAAVRTAQIFYKLPKTGVVNAATWQALLKPPLSFIPSSSIGAPRNTVGAATRGKKCSVAGKPLTALVPQIDGNNIGLTVSGHPTLFFNVPQRNAQIKEADFSLQDENDKLVYETSIILPEDAGAIALTIPTTTTLPELQVGKTYQWTFALKCDSDNNEVNPYVRGVIQRVNRPDLVAKVRQANSKDIPAVYANAGIWYDMLAKLAELRREAPDDEFLLEEWVNYLSAVGLNDFAGEPFVK